MNCLRQETGRWLARGSIRLTKALLRLLSRMQVRLWMIPCCVARGIRGKSHIKHLLPTTRCERNQYLPRPVQRLFFLNGEQDLSAFLLVDMGVCKYPQYRCSRTRPVFQTREDLLAYEKVMLRMYCILRQTCPRSMLPCRAVLRYLTVSCQSCSLCRSMCLC
jgi:hypothetical protein